MLKNMNEAQRRVIIGMCALIVVATLVWGGRVAFQLYGTYNNNEQQIDEVQRDEMPQVRDEQTNEGQIAQHELQTKNKTNKPNIQVETHERPRDQQVSNPRFSIGQEIEAVAFQHEGRRTYKGNIIKTYPETGTVLVDTSRGNVAIYEFSYTDVVDIQAKAHTFQFDGPPEVEQVDMTIRAVWTRDGKLWALRALNHKERVAPRYKIIDEVSKTRSTFYDITEKKCKELPHYVYDLLVEWKEQHKCKA
jgi:uncharacterized protein Veg